MRRAALHKLECCGGWGWGGIIYTLKSHTTRGAINSVINWHVFLVGFSILFVCACVRVVLTVGWWGEGLPHPPTPSLSTADLCFHAPPLTSL